MTQIPDYSSQSKWPGQPAPGVGAGGDLKTSGYAIASLVCGVVGLVTCCVFVPSVLAVVFGFSALSPIRQGEVRGRGLAISGIVLGFIGILVGIAVFASGLLSSAEVPTRQATVSAADHRALESMGVLQQNEEIKVLCTSGLFSVKAGGVVLTGRRLVIYEGSDIQACPLVEIRTIEYTPAESFFDDGHFMIERDDGEIMLFSIAGVDEGDNVFHRAFSRQVANARKAAGKPPLTSEFPSVGESEMLGDLETQSNVEEAEEERSRDPDTEIADDEATPAKDAAAPDPQAQTMAALEACLAVVEEYRAAHDGRAPRKSRLGPLFAEAGVAATDAWAKDFRYKKKTGKDRFEIRSAGPDGKFDTADDISVP